MFISFTMIGNFILYTLLPVILMLVIGYVIILAVMKLVNTLLEKSKLEKVAHSLIKTVVKTVLWGLLLLMVASHLGIDVTGIVALASVLTLAVSLSVQTLLTNLISGFVLLYTKPFHSDDFVEIAGQTGTVLEIGLTYTKLATPDNKEVCIPNSSVTAANIVNYTVRGIRRVETTVSAAYSEPIEKVLDALREAGQVPTALDTPAPFAAVVSYGESAINYTLHVWTNTNDYWATLFDTNANIKAVFDAKGIAMTFPHLNVHLDNTVS